MKFSTPMRGVVAVLLVCAGTAVGALADHRGPETSTKQKQQDRGRPSRAAERSLSTCKPGLKRMDKAAKHAIRDAMRAGMEAMEDAAAADPPMTPEDLDALLKGALGVVEDAAAAAQAELAERRLVGLVESGAWTSAEGRAAYALRANRLDPIAERALQREPTPARAAAALARRLRSLAETPSAGLVRDSVRVLELLPEPARTNSASPIIASIAAAAGSVAVRTSPADALRPEDLDFARAADDALARLPAKPPLSLALDLADVLARSARRADIDRAAELYRSASPSEQPRAALGLAAILRRSGDAAGTVSTLRAYADRVDSAGGSRRPPEYWLAWAEIVEILHEQHAPELLGQIKRLELIDPTLGSPQTFSRIRAVRDRLK
ncbi:MAG: hypothetical protein ACK4WH_04380 [Phycisphaerales bacterium]